jgi:hypothetical protein
MERTEKENSMKRVVWQRRRSKIAHNRSKNTNPRKNKISDALGEIHWFDVSFAKTFAAARALQNTHNTKLKKPKYEKDTVGARQRWPYLAQTSVQIVTNARFAETMAAFAEHLPKKKKESQKLRFEKHCLSIEHVKTIPDDGVLLLIFANIANHKGLVHF